MCHLGSQCSHQLFENYPHFQRSRQNRPCCQCSHPHPDTNDNFYYSTAYPILIVTSKTFLLVAVPFETVKFTTGQEYYKGEYDVYAMHRTGGCRDETELGVSRQLTGRDCATLCDDIPQCISFEYDKPQRFLPNCER